DRQAGVYWEEPVQHHRGDSGFGANADFDHAADDPSGAGAGSENVPSEGPGRALPDGARPEAATEMDRRGVLQPIGCARADTRPPRRAKAYVGDRRDCGLDSCSGRFRYFPVLPLRTERGATPRDGILAAARRYGILNHYLRCAHAFPGWLQTCLCDRRRFGLKVMGARCRNRIDASSRGSRAAKVSVLVARRQLPWFLFGREVEESSTGWRACSGALRRSRRPRRIMESAWRDYLP